jgi:hypothetical protein
MIAEVAGAGYPDTMHRGDGHRLPWDLFAAQLNVVIEVIKKHDTL